MYDISGLLCHSIPMTADIFLVPIVLFYEITIDYVRSAGQCANTVECKTFLCIIYKYCCNIFGFLYILLDFF